MQCVTFVHNVPQIRFWSIFNKIFGLFYKGNWILIDSRGAKHPYFIIVYAYDSGGLAARHRETTAEASERSERDVYDRIYPVPLYALSTVFWAEIRGYLISSLQANWFDVKHVCNTCWCNHLPIPLK